MTMSYRKLGRTGVKVSPLCLGTMMFGQRGNPDHDDCIRILHRALDAGITSVHTANVYSSGESEKIVGPRMMAQLEDDLGALDVRIPDEHLRRIDEIVPPGSDA